MLCVRALALVTVPVTFAEELAAEVAQAQPNDGVLSLFGKLDEGNVVHYHYTAPNDMVWISFHPDKVDDELAQHGSMIEEVAAAHNSKHFVWYDTKEMSGHAHEELGCAEFPCISLVEIHQTVLPPVEGDGRQDGKDEEGRVPVERIFTRTLSAFHPKVIDEFLQDAKDGKVPEFHPAPLSEDEDDDLYRLEGLDELESHGDTL